MTTKVKNLIFVDCEGHGPAPTLNDPASFEFGAVESGIEEEKEVWVGMGR